MSQKFLRAVFPSNVDSCSRHNKPSSYQRRFSIVEASQLCAVPVAFRTIQFYSILIFFRTLSQQHLLLYRTIISSLPLPFTKRPILSPNKVEVTETMRIFRSLLFNVNGLGTRCSLFSRIFSPFPETTLLAGHAGGHPPGCPHRAGLILSKKNL